MATMGEHKRYLREESFKYASRVRGEGKRISDAEVEEILNSPDEEHCDGMTPLKFATSFPDAQTAFRAVSEAVLEKSRANNESRPATPNPY